MILSTGVRYRVPVLLVQYAQNTMAIFVPENINYSKFVILLRCSCDIIEVVISTVMYPVKERL